LITQLCARRRITCVDLYQPFRDDFLQTGQNLYPSRFDHHWSPEGHAIAARVVAAHLLPPR
jgi:hypothetical protein